MSEILIDEKTTLSLLKKLISIESVNPSLVDGGSGEAKIANFIGDYLDKSGFETYFQNLDNDRMNVIGILRGRGDGKALILNGHTDTVGISEMQIEPLSPLIENGRVYGRGAFDMKGSLAAMLAMGDALLKSNYKLEGDLILAFVADEEYASRGTEELVKKFTADAAIVTEPTGLQVIITHRGFAWARINVMGKAAHGSLYEQGNDAIVKAGKVLAGIEKLESTFRHSKQHPLLGRASIHASLIKGGTELSTYPSGCTLQLERRTLPDEDIQTVKSELDSIIEEAHSKDSDFSATSEVFFYRPGLDTKYDIPIVQHVIHACQEVNEMIPELIGALWWTDAALLSEAGIPSILFGPSGEGAHASSEYVDFASVLQTARILAVTTMNYCQ